MATFDTIETIIARTCVFCGMIGGGKTYLLKSILNKAKDEIGSIYLFCNDSTMKQYRDIVPMINMFNLCTMSPRDVSLQINKIYQEQKKRMRAIENIEITQMLDRMPANDRSLAQTIVDRYRNKSVKCDQYGEISKEFYKRRLRVKMLKEMLANDKIKSKSLVREYMILGMPKQCIIMFDDILSDKDVKSWNNAPGGCQDVLKTIGRMGRHDNISIFYLVQHMKMIEKSMRIGIVNIFATDYKALASIYDEGLQDKADKAKICKEFVAKKRKQQYITMWIRVETSECEYRIADNFRFDNTIGDMMRYLLGEKSMAKLPSYESSDPLM